MAVIEKAFEEAAATRSILIAWTLIEPDFFLNIFSSNLWRQIPTNLLVPSSVFKYL